MENRSLCASSTLGMVCAPHHLAAEAGADALAEGGSAVDAAIAAVALLCVVYPHMCSLGGDAFWLLSRPGHPVKSLNATGRAPKKMTLEFFRGRGYERIPRRGLLSVTVPGCVDGMREAHQEGGRLPWKRLLEPAMILAREGFPVPRGLARFLESSAPQVKGFDTTRRVFWPGGRTPREGETLRQPDLADTLHALAEEGARAFYTGSIAKRIDRFCRERGGLLTGEDLSAHTSNWGEAIRCHYRGVTVYETPPNSQGLTTLLILRLLEGFDLAEMGCDSADWVHPMVEAKKLAFLDRDRSITDPAHLRAPVEELLGEAAIRERRSRMDPRRAAPPGGVPEAPVGGDTVAVVAVDAEGAAASLTQSLYFDFGSGVIAGETGVLLHNRGAYFSLDPGHPNCLAPGKRTLHTLMASLLFRGDSLWGAFSTMGADGQPQTHAQVFSRLIDFGMSIGQAISAPRWLSGRFFVGDPEDVLYLEARFPEKTRDGLLRRGHPVRLEEDFAPAMMGHGSGILVADGSLHGAADPRSDGGAAAPSFIKAGE